MKKILLVATIYRVGERIYSIIPKLSDTYDIDVHKTAQMGNKIIWYGDNDFRSIFDEMYEPFIKNSFNELPNLSEYDMILVDDDRPRNGISQIYTEAHKLDIPVVSNYHGSGDLNKNVLERNLKCWDKTFLFGKKDYVSYTSLNTDSDDKFLIGGIPANDSLKKYEITNTHILVIVNFLGNRTSPYSVQVDSDFISMVGLVELQKEFNKKVVFKLKSRHDHPYPDRDINYLKTIVPLGLDYEIVIDCKNDNKLICDSFIVISAPSTLALKSVQKGIPTILIKDSGQIGCFFDYDGLTELNTQKIFDEIERQHTKGRDTDFILNTIEGGLEYNSTEKYIKEIRNII